ncbi:gamma-glutamyltranspeptidase [Candidatus Pantoea carbekii]|uniref:Gamma-glutamyltranspeptidase n=1 Tax=Candidatus Pantoea carbekii TaxID=1235990 RepID=U3U9U7_9GAMM|nr:gamma-glutamyltranspeptidase [Candidatus Pantoea carbekii]
MIHSNIAPLGMAVTPHHLASESALAILREGGNAIEAMVAAASTIAVVYPHMNGLGGDGFWLILPLNGDPIAIDASGVAGSLASRDFYDTTVVNIPYRGPKAAITIAGTISGWQEALKLSREINITTIPFPLSRLLEDAIRYAAHGIPVSESQNKATYSKQHELKCQPGFSSTFLPNDNVPEVGSRFMQPALANIFSIMSQYGLESFYRGEIACHIAHEMKVVGMPITLKDLQGYRAHRCHPLRLLHSQGNIWNIGAPTQGLIALIILGITDRLNMIHSDETQTIHRIIEATKQAFMLRNKYITDPKDIKINIQELLNADYLNFLASQISDDAISLYKDSNRYETGDTVWMGTIDKNGLAVSFIQSLYHEFGSGVVLNETGITWQNRGATFNLQSGHLLELQPGKKPFHTLNPAAARLKNGDVMIYGSMGGDGQPQTQAAIFTRHVLQGLPLQETISAPRWLLGRTWGELSDSIKLESRISKKVVKKLKKLGHPIELISNFSEIVGHAGAIIRHKNGMLEGAFDPRSNGSAAGF